MSRLRATAQPGRMAAVRCHTACNGWALCCIITLTCIIGCGRPRPQIVRVEGTVTLDAKPLRAATVVMIPVDGPTRGEARAITDEAGHFDMVHDVFADTFGVPAGRYRLIVAAFRMPSDGSGQPARVAPERYADPRTSGLELHVTPESTGESVTIALTSSGEPGVLVP